MQITFEGVHGNDEVYLDCLNSLCGDYRESFLDIGCNHAPFTPRLGFKHGTYIDIMQRELDHKDQQQFFQKADALHFLRKEHFYSTIFSLDQIEHVTKGYGWEQLRLMQNFSVRQIVFTPLNPWMMTDENDLNPESHRSLWTPDELDDNWIKIVLPSYHPTLSIGAWFAMNCENPITEFERIYKELTQKTWAINLQVYVSYEGV